MPLYDAPLQQALIDAVRLHLEKEIIPLIKGDPRLYFQTLVAANVLRIVGREAALEWPHVQQAWELINRLQGVDEPLPGDPIDASGRLDQRRDALCTAIRAGDYDDRSDALLHALTAMTRLQLEVANPELLRTLDAEDLQDE